MKSNKVVTLVRPFLCRILLASVCSASAIQVAPSVFVSVAMAQNSIEATPASLDSAWDHRSEIHSKISAFIASKPKFGDDFEVAWRLARMVYYTGFFIDPSTTSNDLKMEIFKYGYEAAEKAIKLDPKRVEGHYWYGVNYGGYGLSKGIMAALSGAEGMRASLDEAVKIDPKYHYAGPLRVRGRLFFKLPGSFISFGDNKKAFADLKKAAELAPESKLNYIYMSEVQAKLEGKAEAVKSLEKAKALPDVVGPTEESSYKRDIVELEKKFK